MESSPHFPTTPNRQGHLIAMVTVVVLYLLPIAGHPPAINPNELVRIELALAMATWMTVDLEEPAGVYGLSEDVAWRNGRVLADKAPGLSLLAIPLVWSSPVMIPAIPGTPLPLYWPLRHLLTGLLVTMGTAASIFLVASRIPDLQPLDWAPIALVAALGTPLWTYGTVFFGHAPAAVLIAISWVLLLRPMNPDKVASKKAFLVGGFAGGFAVATEYPTILLVAVIFISLWLRRTSWRLLTTAFAGLTGGLLPMLVYHQIAFGAPWLTGYAFKAEPGFREIHASGLVGVSLPTLDGLWGVLFGASRGLFFYSPLLLLAPLGLWIIFRRSGWRDAGPLIAAIGIFFAFASGFVDWQAGWCAAARHLVPVVPLMVIPTLVAMSAMARHRWSLLVLTALATLSATRTLATLVITPFFPPEFTDPLRQFVAPSLIDGVGAPNLISAVTGIPNAMVWMATGGLMVSLVVWSLGRMGRSSTPWIAVVTTLVVIGQLGWFAYGKSAPDESAERIRASVLGRLGHTEAAERIDVDLGLAKPSETVRP